MKFIKTLSLTNRNNSLNLIRLILAIFVIIWHSWFMLNLEVDIPYQISYILGLAVPCFFVISGYLITGSAIKHDLKTYFKKRLARIYPAYLFSIISTIILFAPITYTLNNGGNFNLHKYIQDSNILLYFIKCLPFKSDSITFGTTLIQIHANVWNGSAWTLKYEFICYIAIVLILFILTKIIGKKENITKLIFGLYLSSIILSIILINPNTGLAYNNRIYVTEIYFISIFLGGSLAYLIKDKIKFSYKLLFISFIFCIIIMTILPYAWAMEISAIPMVYIILCISIKLKSPEWIKRNDISYGIYVYGWPIQCVIIYIITTYHITISLYSYMIICIILSAGFATLSWFIIEKPILDKVR